MTVREEAAAVAGRVRWETTAVGRTARNAVRYSGPERDTMVQSLKAAGAAIAAWALVGWWLKAPQALLAPWTALALVDATVYRSLRSGLQQFAVILLGTLAAAAALSLTGENTLGSMALVLPPLVLIGTYRRLGTQGIYGATTALFVITYSSNDSAQIGNRLLETAVGAAIGIAVNALILPPVHLRSVRDQLQRLPRESADLLHAVASGAREGWSQADAEGWHDRARRLETILSAVEEARGRSAESTRLNPARKLRRLETLQPPPAADDRWSSVADHLRAITRTLAAVAGQDSPLTPPGEAFFARYADLADGLADLCGVEARELGARGTPGEAAGQEETTREETAQQVREAYQDVAESFRGQSGTAAAVGGGLLVETRQLLSALAGEGSREVE